MREVSREVLTAALSMTTSRQTDKRWLSGKILRGPSFFFISTKYCLTYFTEKTLSLD